MAVPMLLDQVKSLTNLNIALSAVFYDQLTNLDKNSIDVTSALSFFDIQDSTKSQEVNLGIGGFGSVPEYNGSLEYDDFEILFPASYIHKEYAKGFAVERKLWDDGMYNVMKNRAETLGLAFDRTKEMHAASMFNNAFSATYLGPDGKALIATDHPYSTSNTTTQGNKGTAPLTHEAVVAARTAMMGFKDSKGDPNISVPDTLLVPTTLLAQAEVITGSTLKPGTANNDKNVLSTLKPATNPYLTDTNNWYLIDSRKAKMYAHWYWRVKPDVKLDPSSDFNLVMRWRGYMRYSYGWDHWDWIYGSEVAGA